MTKARGQTKLSLIAIDRDNFKELQISVYDQYAESALADQM